MYDHSQLKTNLSCASTPCHVTRAEGSVAELRFPGVDLTVRLTNAPAVQQALSDVMFGWEPTIDRPGLRAPASQPLSHVIGRRRGFAATSPFNDNELRELGKAQATCAILADLAEAWLGARPGMLALHCGAFHMGGGLVMLGGPMRAGKSTLIARLTAEPDVTVFCDDVLPLTAGGEGMALGFAPRLRLPMPDRITPAFRRHVRQSQGPRDQRYAYLAAPNIAPHGTLAPLSTLIMLDRRRSGCASLHRMPADQALHHLLARNMGHLGDAESALDMATQLLGRLTVVRMVYSDLEDAVALLRRTFAPGKAGPGVPVESELLQPLTPLPDVAVLPVDPARIWRQRPGTGVRHIGGSAFLWSPAGTTVWHLNPIAHAIWAALAIPGSVTEMGDLLAELFPDILGESLLADVGSLIAGLACEDFLIPDDSSQWTE